MKKVAIITGSTRGIGRSIALHLGQLDYQVVVNGTKQDLVDEVLQDIERTGGVAMGFVANMAVPIAVTKMVDAVMTKFGRIDVLIHNAGNLHDQKCLRMTDEEWQSVLDVHLNGAFYSIRRVLPYMKESGGDIVLMTSTAGLGGSIGQVNYSAAKAGILGMTWTLAVELKRYNIRVNAISPAALTDMTRPVIEHIKNKYASKNEPFPEFWKVGETDDVARFVGGLLAQQDADLTGEIFGVNGPKVTRWQKPIPIFTENSIDAFFSTWQSRKGSE
ncbi:SDR family NAD(P)-dependent oxidoreductase [Psychrobacillus lasiicapitis]|uniref:SDR family oxidoreductase n=1 Tax=Psychrobacillus lasiicapitis TaxID=1636719 RepID=A0A544T6J5_9BACI|nr:SDR family NAD(P)-dependent oxidoreductase [Psychrobacillus lasiicapitis]TQR13073.1 SDR family oxidoreductase [Psychrobacillus lasiicapitis]GGA34668.1 dehydrogenase [Psychrobacillus lasiicapitis]